MKAARTDSGQKVQTCRTGGQGHLGATLLRPQNGPTKTSPLCYKSLRKTECRRYDLNVPEPQRLDAPGLDAIKLADAEDHVQDRAPSFRVAFHAPRRSGGRARLLRRFVSVHPRKDGVEHRILGFLDRSYG